MSDVQDIYLEPTLNFLVCKLHGNGVHPTTEAIRRHLRGEGHRCRGEILRQAVATLTSLSPSSLAAMRNVQPTIDVQPVVPPISHLKILQGWYCEPCAGHFLTSSLEIVRRHAAATHGRLRSDPPLWEPCEMQTFFSETKDRKYFRVMSSPAGASQKSAKQQSGTRKFQCTQDRLEKVEKVDQVKKLTSPRSELRGSAADIIPYSHRSKVLSGPATPLTYWHPFTSFAAKYVRLPVARVDHLLKSNAFRTASEPLFDPNHVDSDLSMHAVFPHSEEEPAFLNALLYSIVQTTNRGHSTIESLSLQARIIALLNDKLSSPFPTLSPADIGAIMILKTTAYKYCDHVAHDAHTRGLAAALTSCNKGESSLTVNAKQAIFWQDLYAAVLIGSDRSIPFLSPSEKIQWYRESCPELVQALPAGFVRHQDALPHDLLECVADIVEFQAVLSTGTIFHLPNSKPDTLKLMQSSIESRLAVQKNSCTQLGVIAEACRLTIFMCCYCSWMKTWNDSLLPCKLAERLIDMVEPTLNFTTQQNDTVWPQSLDVLLWLLLVSASVVELDQGHVEGLRKRRSVLFVSVRAFLNRNSFTNLEQLLQSASQDFIYCGVWLTQCYGKEWSELELFIHTFHHRSR